MSCEKVESVWTFKGFGYLATLLDIKKDDPEMFVITEASDK